MDKQAYVFRDQCRPKFLPCSGSWRKFDEENVSVRLIGAGHVLYYRMITNRLTAQFTSPKSAASAEM